MELFNVYPLYDIEPVKGEGAFVLTKTGNVTSIYTEVMQLYQLGIHIHIM